MASNRNRPLDKQYDATYVGAPPSVAASKPVVVKERVLNFENMFSDVATHPPTSLRASKKPGATSPVKARAPVATRPKAGASPTRRPAGGAAKAPAPLVRPSSAASASAGALAAERALAAARARQGGFPSGGLAVTGRGKPGAGPAPPVGVVDPVRRAAAGAPPPVRNVAKGRASAAVAARLAHIDALLAKSKAAAGGARGYGACWPASLGEEPPAAAPAAAAAPPHARTPTPQEALHRAATPAAAPSPLLPADVAAAGEGAEEEGELDWEVAEAMKGAEWAVADWESGRDLSAEEEAAAAVELGEPFDEDVDGQANLPPPTPDMTDEQAALHAAATRVQAAARGYAARSLAARMRAEAAAAEAAAQDAVAIKMQAAARGRQARQLAKKLRDERDSLAEMADYSGRMVEDAIAAALQAIEDVRA